MHSGNQPTIGNVPQASGQPQQPVIVIVQAPPTHGSVQQKRSDEEHYRKFFPKKTILGLSVFMLVAGTLSMLFQITLICMALGSHRYGHGHAFIGQGIWCGIFPTVVGGVGIASAKKPSKCNIIALMVLSIVSAAMTIPNLTLDGIGIEYSSGHYYGHAGMAATYSINLILALAAGIISIIVSAYTCQAVCCRKSSAGSVMYNPAAAVAQSIPMTNLDLTSVIHTAQTAAHNQYLPVAERQSQPPAYNTLAATNEYESTTNVQGEKEEKSALTTRQLSDEGTDQYKRFY